MKKINNDMKFYEFSKDRFNYYALIIAQDRKEAIGLYEEVVADIDDKDSFEPIELDLITGICRILETYIRDSDNLKHDLQDLIMDLKICYDEGISYLALVDVDLM